MCTTENNYINLRSAVRPWLMTIGYMALIFYLSSRQNIHLPRLVPNFDKVLHLGAYIPLAYLLYISFKRSGIRKYLFVLAFIVASLYGITDELHQSVVPGRDAAAGDVLADTMGALLGSLGACIYSVRDGL